MLTFKIRIIFWLLHKPRRMLMISRIKKAVIYQELMKQGLIWLTHKYSDVYRNVTTIKTEKICYILLKQKRGQGKIGWVKNVNTFFFSLLVYYIKMHNMKYKSHFYNVCIIFIYVPFERLSTCHINIKYLHNPLRKAYHFSHVIEYTMIK